MDAKTLRDLARRYHDNKEFITNEEMTKASLIVPFITALGYDPSNPREVRLEYTAEFTANDGKRLPDRMDYAIFDPTGGSVMLVIEAKPLGYDVRIRSPQLARYMSQMPSLRFGVITDGCDYLFYGDLVSPNVMDVNPFFSFSLADPKLDFDSVAGFLRKFSKEQFRTEKLVADAEDSNYRQQMIEKVVRILRNPESDEEFIKWLSDGIYHGKRTQGVLERLGTIAREAIQPAILRTIGDDFLANLRTRINEVSRPAEASLTPEPAPIASVDLQKDEASDPLASKGIETTEEELEFHQKVRDICVKNGESPESILYRDTLNYFNVSFNAPTKWFIRLFSGGRRKAVTTLVPVEEARELASGFEIEEAPTAFGASRIYIDSIDQVWGLAGVVARSLEICRGA